MFLNLGIIFILEDLYEGRTVDIITLISTIFSLITSSIVNNLKYQIIFIYN